MKFKCRKCGKMLKSSNDLKGMPVKCPGCNVAFRAPTVDTNSTTRRVKTSGRNNVDLDPYGRPKRTMAEVKLLAVQGILSDTLWQVFGYRRRPRGGRFWQSFRASWKNELEERICHEILSTVYAWHFKHDQIDATCIRHAILHALENDQDPMDEAFTRSMLRQIGYSDLLANCESVEHAKCVAASYITGSVEGFVDAQLNDWCGILATNIDVLIIPDYPRRLKLVAGFAQYPLILSHVLSQSL